MKIFTYIEGGYENFPLFTLLVLMNAFPMFNVICPCLSIANIDNIYLFITFTLFPLLFCSVLFCSVLFCSVLFCSVLFCSVLFWTVLNCSELFWTDLNWSVLICSDLFWSVLICSDLFWSVLHFDFVLILFWFCFDFVLILFWFCREVSWAGLICFDYFL
jgi:hypothetical protein